MVYVEVKCKELKTNYPFISGLTGGTESQIGRIMNLVPEKSFVPKRLKIGLR